MKVDLTQGGRRPLPSSITHVRMNCVSESQRLPNVTRLLAALRPVRSLLFASTTADVEAAMAFLATKKIRALEFVSTKTNVEREAALRKFAQGSIQVCWRTWANVKGGVVCTGYMSDDHRSMHSRRPRCLSVRVSVCLCPLLRSLFLSLSRSGPMVQVLVCLEGGSRGLDFKNVDLVMNLNPPGSKREYVHRAGRTGRCGRPGVVVTLCDGGEEAATVEDYVKAVKPTHPLVTVSTDNLFDVAPSLALRRKGGKQVADVEA